MSTLDRTTQLSFNLSGVTSVVSTASDTPAPQGYYLVNIDDSFIDPSKNPNNIRFKLSVASGPEMGKLCWGSIMKLGSTKNDNSRFWRALFESMGFSPAQLDGGQFQFSLKDFVGKSAHIYWEPGDRDAGVWDECSFLSPGQWESQKAQFVATAGSAIATPTTPQPTVAPATPAPSVAIPSPGLTSPAPTAAFVPDNAVQTVDMQSVLGTRPN